MEIQENPKEKKKMQTCLSENMLTSGHFNTTLYKIWANFQLPPPPPVKQSIRPCTPMRLVCLVLQQFASKHKPQTFSRVCLRLKRDVYRWKRNVSLLM
jgi:hypothetical protein